MMKVLAVLLMSLSPILLDEAMGVVNLVDMGEVGAWNIQEGSRPELAVSLDSIKTLPKDVYYTNVSVISSTDLIIEDGVEIQFETKERKLGFFVLGNLKLEKGVYLHSVNNKGEEPKWLGLQVMPTGRLEADDLRIEGVPDEQPVWMLIYGTAVIRNSTVSRVRVSDYFDDYGDLTLENCVVNGLSFGAATSIKAQNTSFKLANPEGTPEVVHAVAYAFKGKADFSQNNQWEGDKPIFWIFDRDTNGVVSDVNVLEKLGIKLLPPTAVENMSWGVIKKIFSH